MGYYKVKRNKGIFLSSFVSISNDSAIVVGCSIDFLMTTIKQRRHGEKSEYFNTIQVKIERLC